MSELLEWRAVTEECVAPDDAVAGNYVGREDYVARCRDNGDDGDLFGDDFCSRAEAYIHNVEDDGDLEPGDMILCRVDPRSMTEEQFLDKYYRRKS